MPSSSAARFPVPPPPQASGVRLRVVPAREEEGSVLSLEPPTRDPAPPSGPRRVGDVAFLCPRPGLLCYAGAMADDPLQPLSDAALAGDAAAMRRLLEQVAPAMLLTVRAVLGRGAVDAEDVLQESLVALLKALQSFRGESSVLHFARAVALRRALQHRRSRARRAPEVELDLSLRDAGAGPARDSLAAARRDVFRGLLEELREDQAETFAQRVLLGYSMEEIATLASIPLGTVKSRLRLAKAALRARIEGDPELLDLLERDDDDGR